MYNKVNEYICYGGNFMLYKKNNTTKLDMDLFKNPRNILGFGRG